MSVQVGRVEPLPPLDARDLLDRERELAAADAVLREAVGGRGGLLLVEGPPGIGKTVVLRAVAERARHLTCTVLRATGSELESDLSYGVVRQLFDAEARRAASVGLPGPLGPAASALGVEDPDGADRRSAAAVLHALHWLVLDLAERAPLALVVDDAQWADEASLRWLGYVARRIATRPVALVLAMRSTHNDDRRLDHLAIDDRAGRVLRLGPLTTKASRLLLGRWLDAEPPEDFCAAAHDVTGGNPLLLREMSSELAVRDHRFDPGVLTDLGSASVARTALGRVARLSPLAAEVARVAGVLGPRATAHRVAAVAGLAVADVLAAAGALVDVQVLREDTPFAFAHPLVAAAVYRHQPAAARAATHAATARVLDADGLAVEEVAGHLLLAEPNGDLWVVERLRAAAQRSLASGEPGSAVRLLRRALDEPAGPTRPEVLLALGQVEVWVLDRAALEHLAEAFATLEDPVERARAALPLARLAALTARWGQAVELIDAALAALPPDAPDDVWLALTGDRLLAAEGGDVGMADYPRRVRELSDRAAPDSPASRVGAAHRAILAVADHAPRDDVAALLRTAWGEGRLLAEQGPDSGQWLYVGWAFGMYGFVDEAADIFQTVLEDGRRAGSPIAIFEAQVSLGWLALHRGDLTRAHALFEEALAVRMTKRATGWRLAVAGLVYVALWRGDVARAADLLEPYPKPVAEPPDRCDALVALARGALAHARGDLTTAEAEARAVGEWATRHGIDNPADLPWRVQLARALVSNGRLEDAAATSAEDLARARRTGVASAIGRALHAASFSAAQGVRVELLREAARVLAGCPVRVAYAMALVDLAAAERRAGDREAARRAAAEALVTADACGAGPLRTRALEELRLCGARPRRVAVVGLEALTVAERRVAELAARGRSNRAIAATLVVSEKTVEKHLASTFRKLAVTRRDELGQILPKQ